MTVGELRTYIPQVDWQRYLTIVLDRPVNVSENVVVFALRYLEDLVALLGKTEPRFVYNPLDNSKFKLLKFSLNLKFC